MKKVDIVFGELEISKVYKALTSNDTKAINQPVSFTVDDNKGMDDKALLDEIIRISKSIYVDHAVTEQYESNAANKDTDPRACVFIHNENGELLQAYEIDNLLYREGPTVKTYSSEGLRQVLEIESSVSLKDAVKVSSGEIVAASEGVVCGAISIKCIWWLIDTCIKHAHIVDGTSTLNAIEKLEVSNNMKYSQFAKIGAISMGLAAGFCALVVLSYRKERKEAEKRLIKG